jgi:hypothetical protein
LWRLGTAGAGTGAVEAEPSASSFNSIWPRRSFWPGFKMLSVIFSSLMKEPLVEFRSRMTMSLPRRMHLAVVAGNGAVGDLKGVILHAADRGAIHIQLKRAAGHALVQDNKFGHI